MDWPQDPVIIVGIDVGMTYIGNSQAISRTSCLVTDFTKFAGVAHVLYDPSRSSNDPFDSVQVIEEWPPQYNETHPKVPTCIALKDGSPLIKWGFECHKDFGQLGNMKYPIQARFKLMMDRDHARKEAESLAEADERHKEAQELYYLYLVQIHHYITGAIHHFYHPAGGKRNFLDTHHVLYLFSVLTTLGGSYSQDIRKSHSRREVRSKYCSQLPR